MDISFYSVLVCEFLREANITHESEFEQKWMDGWPVFIFAYDDNKWSIIILSYKHLWQCVNLQNIFFSLGSESKSLGAY